MKDFLCHSTPLGFAFAVSGQHHESSGSVKIHEDCDVLNRYDLREYLLHSFAE